MRKPGCNPRRGGGACLAGAIVLFLFGVTLLEGRLQGLWFVAYWLVCLLLLGAAMASALVDLLSLRRRLRNEQRQLIQDAVSGLDSKAARTAEPFPPRTKGVPDPNHAGHNKNA